MKSSAVALSIASFVLVSACGLGAHPPPAPPRQTSLGLKISGLELTNGLRVVLVQDPRAAEIQVTMRYQVGSVDDPPEQAGVAHLVEHLMFQQVLGAQSLLGRLENISTFHNAFTSFDATTYVARAEASHLEELLSIEAVRVGYRCTSITDSAFAREREVVINELRQRDETTELLAAIHIGLYPAGHPYRRPTGGSVDSVGAITREQACAFADAHYAPKNAVLVVSGDVTPAQLTAALGKFLARIAKREVGTPMPAPRVELASRHVETSAPIDDEMLLVAWPLPQDPQLRARVRAIAVTTQQLVDQQVRGRVTLQEFGDGRAPMLGLAVSPATGETIQDAIDGAERGINSVPGALDMLGATSLGEVAFDRIQQTAIYKLYATLEDGGDRDSKLAAYVLAGRDPSTALSSGLAGLNGMTRDEAARIARDNLSFDRATVVKLTPSDTRKRGHTVALRPAIHDLGPRRDPPDPADAHRAAVGSLGAHGFVGVTTRELPNGLKVVLLPLTSVPTIDMRLVFGSGSADEPADKRGAALVAAHALTWDLHFLNDLLLFAAGGGTELVEVGTDHTTFAAHGLDMHFDLLLAGLRRWIREGRYDRGAETVVDAMRRESKTVDDEGAFTDAWRTALYGDRHPYVDAGLARHASKALTVEDAARFRAAHYTPDNATLVISGRFDVALANQWIDYLFADWTGRAEARRSQRSSLQPASIAKDEATTQVQLRIALPATANLRAHQLVAAEMLAEIASDVRHQLGASYGLDAGLAESRLATSYVLGGAIDAARTNEAVELLRTRIEKLRIDPDAAARAFVSARNRVLTHLVSVTGSAAIMGERVEHDIDLARAPMSDLRTAAVVQQLTIDGMAATLAELDLSRAAVVMRGPAAEIDTAFDVLGRKATHLLAAAADHDAPEPAPATTTRSSRDDDAYPTSLSDLADALTEQGAARAASPFTVTIAPGYETGRLTGLAGVDGYSVAADFGYRLDQITALGLHVSIGHVSGSYDTGAFVPELHPFDVVPLGISGFLQGTGYDRLWGAVLVGIHFDRFTDGDSHQSAWYRSLGVGVQGGVDLVKFQRHRLGAYGRVESELISDTSYAAFTLGVAYRM
jgi:zinc protease